MFHVEEKKEGREGGALQKPTPYVVTDVPLQHVRNFIGS